MGGKLEISLVEHDDGPNVARLSDPWLFLDTIVYFVVKFINYGFMLCAMTFNFWVVLVICLGMAIGDFAVSCIRDYIHVQRYKIFVAYREECAKKHDCC